MNTELVNKLRLESYNKKLLLNKPNNIIDFDSIVFNSSIKDTKYDLIFAFIFNLSEFTNLLNRVINKELLNQDGIIYFAYPKKGNKEYSQFIGRDDFFGVIDMDNEGYIHNSPIKFNKMIALNDTFTIIGLKHQKKRKKSNQPSQCVADYVDRVSEIQNYLENKPDVLLLFNQLTPGYQGGWARYVFGVKTLDTTKKRFEEMESILKQGYKTKDLFQKSKK